ncbi:MAG: uroporphyrinogen-III C-methyltransferase [Defluviitaleaceae bacterium]|nr:uroporphyrinogen-III C-methyltransferase [Defluviitaleaceae bacterium]
MNNTVFLVGAGPGDFKLLTLKGLECVRQADVIIYDELVNTQFLREAGDDCELVYAGKSSGCHTLPQDQIHAFMIEKAKQGKTVVRLKGGDPYVFGRGGEEAQALRKSGIAFEVVPGVSSAIGGPAYAGIPITHRDYASSFHVIAGHSRVDGQHANEPDWDTLAKLDGTLVFLMGVGNLRKITQYLLDGGKPADTPAALISRACGPNQRVVTTTLVHAYDAATENDIGPPAIIVIGGVVSLREELNFFERKPLFGKSVILTRAKGQNDRMSQKISDLGGEAIEAPSIKIVTIPGNRALELEIARLNLYKFLIFTSQNSVDIFFAKLYEMGLDARSLAGTRIAAVGSQTALTLSKKGIRADLVPRRHTAAGLVQEISLLFAPMDKVLIPRAVNAPFAFSDALNADITEVGVYETIPDHSSRELALSRLREGRADYLTFTSPSCVSGFVAQIGAENLPLLDPVRIIAIGPVTGLAVQSHGLRLHRQAAHHSSDAIIECIKEDAHCQDAPEDSAEPTQSEAL